MALDSISYLRPIASAALFFLSVGCTSVVRSDNLEGLHIGSPLRKLNPKTFTFRQFKDIRTDDPFYVGDYGRGYLKIDQPAANVVALAIRRELERNGHQTVTDPSASNPDYIVDGTVYKFGLSKITGWKHELTSTVAVKISIIAASDPGVVFDKKYEGTYAVNVGIPPLAGGGTEIFNQGLLGMLKELSADEELLSFLEK
jgi:hypothetical protein